MNPESRELLDLVRDAEDPRPEDERRVLAAVRVAVAGGAVAGAGAGAGLSVGGAAKLAKLFGGWTGPGAKVVGVAACLIAAGGVAAWPTAEVAPVEPAPAASTASTAPAQVAPPPAEPAVNSAATEIPIPATSAAAAPLPAARAPSLRDELALLAEVQASLKRGDGEAALRRLDAHATTDQQLLAERDAARVLALCAAGRAIEARAAADAFVLRHPSSPQRTAVTGACGAPKPASD